VSSTNSTLPGEAQAPAATSGALESHAVWRVTPAAWGLLGVAAAAILLATWSGLAQMLDWMLTKPEYGHGFLIPFIAAFLLWQRSDKLRVVPFTGSSWGFVLILTGALIGAAGKLSALFTLEHYAAVLMLYGIALALTGRAAFRLVWVPLFILLFMIPLPEFLYRNLSAQLQLISSEIGAWFVRRFGIPVFLEGNVIDLGSYKLQVAEACSGLRYLFPLMTIGFLMACFFRVAFWKRAVVFLSSIPLTILMNSFRIGAIGVMVEHWGAQMAEGFLHGFQGWVVFMLCGALMVLEMVVLARLGSDHKPWREVFGLELPTPAPRFPAASPRPLPASFKASLALLVVVAAASLTVPDRAESIPPRVPFALYPDVIGGWSGQRQVIESIYLDELKLDDYYFANFTRAGEPVINFYVAWYDSQRSGRSAHSPRSCLPGGGWRIESLTQRTLPGAGAGREALTVNRVVIRLGNRRQLVYYWFQQRGRALTNEYAVKLYLLWDALARNRTDGALVRLMMPLPQSGKMAAVDAELAEFAAAAAVTLSPYIPN
jgi:exosortase D (VPLPA-CTERM-specific)